MFRVTSLRRVLNKDARVEVLIDLETIRWKSELFVAQDDQDYLDSLVANLMTEILLQKCPSQIKGLIMKSSLNLLQKKKTLRKPQLHSIENKLYWYKNENLYGIEL